METNLASIGIGILTSLIASIIILFCSNYIKRKTSQLLEWFSSKNKKYSDNFYSDAARNNNYNLEYFTGFILLLIFAMSITIITLEYTDTYKIIHKIIKENPDVSQMNLTKLYELKNEYIQTDKYENLQFVVKHFWLFTFVKYFFIVFSISLFISFYLKMFRSRQIKQCNRAFVRYLDIIAPYISPKEILVLKSDWARMKSTKDYDRIREGINKHLKLVYQDNKENPEELNQNNQ